MAPLFLRSWRSRPAPASRTGSQRAGLPSRWRSRLWLQVLEGRCLPSTVTNLNDAGAGSLRQAILDTPPGGTVDFQPGLSGTITLTSGELAINQNLTIAGPGASVITVSGNQASRVFDIVGPTATVDISGLTIANGRITSVPENGEGGGIYNAGTLTITNSILSGSSAADEGGGIYNNAGTLTVTASTFTGNSADSGGGGIYSAGGSVSLSHCLVAGNSASAGAGGGVYVAAGTLQITNSTLSGNQAIGFTGAGGTPFYPNGGPGGPGAGGGLYVTGGTVSLASSTLSANTATGGTGGTAYDHDRGGAGGEGTGGAIYLAGGTVNVIDSTLAGNQAIGGVGGTGDLGSRGPAGPAVGAGIDAETSGLTITNTTISGNSVSVSQGGSGTGGGVYAASTLSVRNTIVAGNSAASADPDVEAGTVHSQGYNLIGDGTGSTGWTATDLVGTSGSPIDPLLGPLQDHGGPTQTMALLPGSPAIDAGGNVANPGFDQRGASFPRLVHSVTDIGAFEVQSATPLLVTNANDAGPGSLRQAILDANASPGGDTITFDMSGTGVHTISPTSPLPALTKPVTIDGSSQPGYAGTPLIEINGSGAGPGADGLTLTAGGSEVDGLVIGGFAGAGIHVQASGGNLVASDYLGTDPSGTQANGNGTGLFIDGTSNNTIVGSLISGNTGDGMTLAGDDNVVWASSIGTNATRTARLSNGAGMVISGTDNTVGGADSRDLNVIAANLGDGVLLSTGATGNVLQDNVISRNRGNGVEITAGANGNTLLGNFIGTTPDGSLHLPNVLNGVLVAGSNNTVGGTAVGAGNTIAYNGNDGVLVDTGTGNALHENSIFANGGLGIELRNHGNQSQTAPTLTFALSGLGATLLRGTLTAAPATTYAVELFGNPDAAVGAGERFLGSLTVTTDASGQAAFKDYLHAAFGQYLTATATDPAGNTSAFSASLAVAEATVTTLDYGLTGQTGANGINDAGQIVGGYSDANYHPHGFLLSGGSYTTLDVPGASETGAYGINDTGQIVGLYWTNGAEHGFLVVGGSYTTLDVPGAQLTEAYGINDAGQIVGRYEGATGGIHGFLLVGGTYTTLDVPGATGTEAYGINDAGQIVGSYYANSAWHGFLLSGGTYGTLDVPGATWIRAAGINDAGQIVGSYESGNPSNSPYHGFLLAGGAYISLDVPGDTETFIQGINDAGGIVGSFGDSIGGHGFVATKPSTPASVAEPDLSALTPALANVVVGPSGSATAVNLQEPTFGADPAAPWADSGSERLGLSSANPRRPEAAATLPSPATLHHARDAVFAGLGDPAADSLAGSLVPAGW